MEIVLCDDCGYILHRGNELVTPKDIVKKYSGRCPKCSSILNNNDVKIKVLYRESTSIT